ncbi:tRNA (N6-isopentenyl adenosine(37)-C2)-methylthiotransferase MiaB [Leadbettera azotonutricia]|uniref:tRNA-2-methylthio-N(6)-dimethylallyladenosine synthase n=1 Tax=Leadbettera azotonutricia (strain ATCC BAA-888 / DSM 13862 / ZAS-9) TaxID=545695 RepID=F5Y8I8_LEAAZ|nr:tRNA (N6-isopentenyl adenosine(37)-C2)-methylthiotransferase MiaB [Leadbettera azotonutricia]AEF82769.1 tRNA-I(6)A37 thiotransferase enzyme MiaB [Leadbettera azotonutricia ZAS-9]
MKYFFETYGCQMNSAESAALGLAARERGWEEAESAEDANLVLLNTCTVRATAEQRVMGRLAHYESLKKKRRAGGAPSFTLVIAGCVAQRLGDSLKEKFPAIDYVMGTSARSFFPLILEAAEQHREAIETGEKPDFAFSSSHLEEGQFRAFIPIMHGCNNFCSYCIVPYVRGREISRSPASILDEIRMVGEKGVKEITLLGQNVNSYNWVPGTILDFPGLLELIAEYLEKERSPIRWVRFLSSHPKDLSPRAIQVMAGHKVFCRHLHLCVQHGSNSMLKAMNRRYTREHYLELVSELRAAMPGLTLSTDLLIGFPGETEEDLEETFSLMEEVKFLYAYTYHYNPREGTAAYDLQNRIPESVKRNRLARVIKLQQQHTAELLKGRLGAETEVLIEGISHKNADELITRTERDEMAVVPGKAAWLGHFGHLVLSDLKGMTFRAKEITLTDR